MKNNITLLLLMACCVAGCETAGPVIELPAYHWRDSSSALDDLAARSSLLQSASGTAMMSLRRADGASVQVDSAFAMKQPDSLRIRAWKMNRAVADWTLLPEGVWAWQTESEEPSPTSASTGPWSAHHAEMWPLLFGIVTWRAGDVVHDDGKEMLTVGRRIGNLSVHVIIARRTLTVTECRVLREDGTVVQRVLLQRYQPIDGVYWPMLVLAEGEAGAFELRFEEITINEELPDAAFTPPSRARRVQ